MTRRKTIILLNKTKAIFCDTNTVKSMYISCFKAVASFAWRRGRWLLLTFCWRAGQSPKIYHESLVSAHFLDFWPKRRARPPAPMCLVETLRLLNLRSRVRFPAEEF